MAAAVLAPSAEPEVLENLLVQLLSIVMPGLNFSEDKDPLGGRSACADCLYMDQSYTPSWESGKGRIFNICSLA